MQGCYARKMLAQCLALLMMVGFFAMVGCSNDDNDNEFDADVAALPDTTNLNSANIRVPVTREVSPSLQGLAFQIDAAAFDAAFDPISGLVSTAVNGPVTVNIGTVVISTTVTGFVGRTLGLHAAARVDVRFTDGTFASLNATVTFPINPPPTAVAGTVCSFAFPVPGATNVTVNFATCRIGVGGDDVVRQRAACNGVANSSNVPGTMILILANPTSGVTYTSAPPTGVELSITDGPVIDELCVNDRPTGIEVIF